jgi:mannose-1-phosphate guanylyltransferase
MIVAASHDGILICGKHVAENVKKYVEPLDSRPMFEDRRWGSYRVLDDSRYADGLHSLTKSITLNEGKFISYQKHSHRAEVWTFVEGEGIFVLDGQARKVRVGDTVVIPVGHLHSIKAITNLTFIEVQMGHPLVEEDIERFDWDWDNMNV